MHLICGELGGFRRGKHSAALFHNPNQVVRMAVHGDDSVCLSDDDGLKHIDSLLKSKFTAKDMGTLGFEDSDVKRFLLLNRVFRVGTDQTGQYFDIEPDLRHAPLIINESDCKHEHHSSDHTTRETTKPTGVRRKVVSDSKEDEATRNRSACMRLSYLAQDRLDLAETAKHSAQRMREPREFDFVLLKRAARYLMGKPKAALRCRTQKHVNEFIVFMDSDFAGDPVSKKSTTGLLAQIGNHTVKSACDSTMHVVT